MIAIIDYGVGNLFSLVSSLRYIGADAVVTSDITQIHKADKLILPGVGAFADAINKLKEKGLDAVIKEEAAAGKKMMGICLGMQLLFEKSFEYGEHEGLGLLKGSVVPMEGNISDSLKIPHIGWNQLEFAREHYLFKKIKEKDCVYFVHSYYAEGCDDSLIAVTDYGRKMTAAVAKDNVMGCQFHPEKSGSTGLAILEMFCEGE